jgi:hypothetical protein
VCLRIQYCEYKLGDIPRSVGDISRNDDRKLFLYNFLVYPQIDLSFFPYDNKYIYYTIFFFIICIEKAIGFGDELFSVNDESNSFHLLFSDISLLWLELSSSMWSKSIRTSYLLIKKNWLWIWVDLWFLIK